MMPAHRIGCLRLDVTLNGGASAGLERGRAVQQHLMGFCADALDAGMAPVLDSARAAVIGTLELDLGTLPLARFETEFAGRLRHALHARLWRLGLLREDHGQNDVAAAAPAVQPAQLDDVPPAPAPAERALARLLRDGAALTAAEMTALHDAVRSLAAMSAASTTGRRWRRLLEGAAGAPLERARISRLPPALLMRLVPLLLPAPHANEVGVLLAALTQTLPSGQRARAARVVWETWFDQWHRQRAQRWSSAQFQAALARRLRSQCGLQQARLLQARPAAVPQRGPARRSLAPDGRRKPVERILPEAPGSPIRIDNAGLVLLHPFLPAFFDKLGLLAEGAFIDDKARSRAVALLHFLAGGESPAPDHALALNKFLCGLSTAAAPVRVAPPDAADIALGLALLDMVTQRWEHLRNTSVAGLRSTFLLRPGTLVAYEGKSTLHVPHRTVDILKQTLPWQCTVIKLPWMAQPLFVDWR